MDTVMIIIYVVASLLAFMLAVAAYSGLFHRIDVQTLDYPLPGLTLAYKFYRGPFTKVGSAFQELSRVAPGKKCLAVYYDSPCQVKPDDLRWVVGCVVSESGSSSSRTLKSALEEKGYHEVDFPAAKKAVQTTFPWRNTLSIYIAVMRVWNALVIYQTSKSLVPHPWMEVYSDGVIRFIGILDHHTDFYVPETGGVVTVSQEKTT